MTGSSALAIASPTSVPGWCVPAATERPGGGLRQQPSGTTRSIGRKKPSFLGMVGSILREGPHTLPHVLALGDQRLRERLLLEAGLEPALVGALEEALRHAEGERRATGEPLAPRARRGLELRSRHHLVAESE